MPRKPALRKIFHGKVLLFGEHIINHGARGYATPVEQFYGWLSYPTTDSPAYAAASNQAIGKLALYLANDKELSALYDVPFLLQEVAKGVFFESNIPEGYGLGSSGALVAAIYHRYRKEPRHKPTTDALRQQLAATESFFHGKSSGLDPLVCFLNHPVLVQQGRARMLPVQPQPVAPAVQVYLVDTGKARDTATWVKLFLNRCGTDTFKNMVEKSLVPASNLCIQALQDADSHRLMTGVRLISQIQWNLMKEFIPKNLHTAWAEGLRQSHCHFKICGAGGGGFMLCFAQKDFEVQQLLPSLRWVPLMQL